MRKQASYRESELLAYALAEIELLKAALLRISDGRQLVLAPGSSMGTTPGIETSGHVLYGSKHTKALCVTAGSGLSVNYEDGAVVVDGTYYQVGSGNLAGLTNNTTNYVFVQHNGSVNKNTTGFPLDGIPLAVVVTVGGVVTSVIDARAYLSVQSPVTLGANLAADISLTGQALELCVQAKNTVLAGPISGSNAYPAFRSLNIADIPNLSSLYSVLAHTHDAYLNKDGTVALTGNWVQSGVYAIRTAGYMRVGSSAAPTNVTAGDITAIRMLLGNLDAAFPNGECLYMLRIDPALSGTRYAASIDLRAIPGAASTGTTATLHIAAWQQSSYAIGILEGVSVEPTIYGAGLINYIKCYYGQGWGTFGAFNANVTTVDIYSARMFYREGGAGVLSVGTMHGLFVESPFVGTLQAGDSIGTIKGVYIRNLGGTYIGNAIGIDIAAQSGASGVNFGIRNAGNMVQTGYMRVGAVTVPSNVTAGDLNAARLFVGADAVITVEYTADIVGKLRTVGTRNDGVYVATPSAVQDLVAATAILANAETVQIKAAGGSVTLTSTPTIATGYEGQIVTIVNVDAANSVTLQDQGTLANSNLRLSANTITLGPRDSIQMQYFTAIGDWIQTGQVNVL
jgi:hypothetical protein